MTFDQGGAAYRQVEVGGATGLQLVVMLYDGAIRFLGDAKVCIQKKDLHGKAMAIDRALAILAELQSTLERNEGGEVAASLDRMYTYITERVLEASFRLNPRPLDEAVKLLRILQSAWTEIAARSGAVAAVPALPTGGNSPEPVPAGGGARPSGPLELFG